MQRKITLAYGIAFSATVFGSILGFTISKQDEKAAFLSQNESMAQLVLINSFKGSVIELLIHQDELLTKISASPQPSPDIQARWRHFVDDYSKFKQDWLRLSQVASARQTYGADPLSALATHETSVSLYIRQVDRLAKQIDASDIQPDQMPILYNRLTDLSQSFFTSELEGLLDTTAALEAALQQEHTESATLLKRATDLQIQITIVSILLSGGLGALLMNKFSHIVLSPLQTITRLTQQSIQTEALDLELPTQSQDEVGLLAQTLNLYVQKLTTSQTELQKEEEILQRQSATLAQLSQSHAIAQGDLMPAFQELTEATARLLQVERVSIWLLDDGQNSIRCATVFQLSHQTQPDGCELTIADYPLYFAAVLSSPVLAVDNVQNDPRTHELITSYVNRFHIASMLDASFSVDGAYKGIICCETVGSQRNWSQAEQNVVRSVANLVALTLEVNQRHQKAEQLEQALTDLKKSQFQMIHSEKMAALGQLISGIAHEINNPISVIHGNLPHAQHYVADLMALIDQYQTQYPNPPGAIATALKTIELDFLREDLNKLLQSMQVGSERIHSIVTSMRHFSRLDDSDVSDADIHVSMDNSLLLLNTRLRAQHWRPAIGVVKDYGILPPVTCCAGQITQVLMNLLSNAIDAIDEKDRLRYSDAHPDGTAPDAIAQQPSTIEIQTRSQPQSSTPSVVISVTDNGIGMSQDTCDRLFEAFFTTKPVGKGTGLGLSISHQIVVENHGGHLSCSSEPGQGTTFTVILPCHGREDNQQVNAGRHCDLLTQGDTATTTPPDQTAGSLPRHLRSGE